LDIPTADVLDFETALFEFIKTKYPEIPQGIKEKKVLEEDNEQALIKAINECKADFLKGR
jgi:F-type H+-transporting ATPase subunit alpha